MIDLILGCIVSFLIGIVYDKHKNRLQIAEINDSTETGRIILENNSYYPLILRIHRGEYSFLCMINQGNCQCKWHDEHTGEYLTGFAQNLMNDIQTELQKHFEKTHSPGKIKKIIRNVDKRTAARWRKQHG